MRACGGINRATTAPVRRKMGADAPTREQVNNYLARLKRGECEMRSGDVGGGGKSTAPTPAPVFFIGIAAAAGQALAIYIQSEMAMVMRRRGLVAPLASDARMELEAEVLAALEPMPPLARSALVDQRLRTLQAEALAAVQQAAPTSS